MPWAVLNLVLDSGGRELTRLMSTLLVVVLLALLLAVVAPLALIAGATTLGQPPAGSSPGAAPPPTTPARLSAAVPGSGPQLPAPTGSRPVEIARGYLGVPYVFGGSNPATGLDCSGLVQLVYRQSGVALPRTAQLQYEATTRLTREQLQPGDLVFFARTYPDPHDWITHVGIYAGDGLQINAPTTGQVVSVQPVFSGFWGAHFASGGRVRRP